MISALLDGAKQSLAKAGVKEENIVVQSVPGSYELPYAVKQLYSASQVQSSSTGFVGAAADLLGSTSDLTKLNVSGQTAGDSNKPFDAIIAIGVLIKGETMHFEYISGSVCDGLMRVQLDTGVPVILGVLTVMTEEQAQARAGVGSSPKKHNHGEDWGLAAVEMGAKRREWAAGQVV